MNLEISNLVMPIQSPSFKHFTVIPISVLDTPKISLSPAFSASALLAPAAWISEREIPTYTLVEKNNPILRSQKIPKNYLRKPVAANKPSAYYGKIINKLYEKVKLC